MLPLEVLDKMSLLITAAESHTTKERATCFLEQKSDMTGRKLAGLVI